MSGLIHLRLTLQWFADTACGTDRWKQTCFTAAVDTAMYRKKNVNCMNHHTILFWFDNMFGTKHLNTWFHLLLTKCLCVCPRFHPLNMLDVTTRHCTWFLAKTRLTLVLCACMYTTSDRQQSAKVQKCPRRKQTLVCIIRYTMYTIILYYM